MLKKTDNKGFTIIEVLIVLAIAGLIMLVVFLAVPALQRNSRNSQRKSDVSAILGAISSFNGNNNGSIPERLVYGANDVKSVAVTCFGNTPVLASATTVANAGADWPAANCGATNNNFELAKLGFYDIVTAANTYIGHPTAAGTVATAAPGIASTATVVSADGISIILGYSCGATASDAYVANTRAVSIYYVTETGSGNGAIQCQGS